MYSSLQPASPLHPLGICHAGVFCGTEPDTDIVLTVFIASDRPGGLDAHIHPKEFVFGNRPMFKKITVEVKQPDPLRHLLFCDLGHIGSPLLPADSNMRGRIPSLQKG